MAIAGRSDATRTILVIDDNVLTRKLVRHTLRNEGFTIIEASDGREALEKARATIPDLILQDLLLPDIDGFELVGRLRGLPRIAQVPIIAFSGLLSRFDYRRAASLGFTDFLAKPVEPSWLLQVVQSHLGASASELGNQAAMNAAFAQRSAMHASMLAMIAGISQTLTKQLHIDEALPDVLESLLEASGVSRGALFMQCLDGKERDSLSLATTNGFSEALASDLATFCGLRDVFDGVVARKSPLVIGTANDAPGARALLTQLGGVSALLVPFVADEICPGILLLVSSGRELVEPDWGPFARSMSVHIGQALALSHTVAQLTASVTERRRSEAELRLLERLALAASAAPDLSATFEVVLRLICETTGWTLGSVWVPDPETAQLVCSRTWTRNPEDAIRFTPLATPRFAIGEGILGRVWASRTPLWVSDLASEPDSLRSPIARQLGVHAALVVPVTTDTDVIAIIEFFMTEERSVDTRFIKVVSTTAVQLASVIARKTAEASLVERLRISALAAEVGLELTKPGPLDQVLHACTDAIVRNLDAAFARIWTLKPGSTALELQATAGVHIHVNGQPAKIPISKLAVKRVTEQRKPYLSNNLVDDRLLEGDDAICCEREGVIAFAGHPLIVGGELVGVIAITSRNRLSDSTLDGLAAIADAVAIGIQRKVVELANATLEAQLLQAQKMEAVGRLAGGIAHDFNNLLSVILSYGDMIVGDLNPGDPMREDVEEICKAGHRAADLTRQLLMFSRQQVVEPKVLDLNDVLASLDKMLQRILGADVALTLLPAEQLGRVHVDRGSIEQVVMNLVVNARDAMPTGGKLTMETANVMLDEAYAQAHVGVKAGPHVMLAVSDSGTGMDAATRSRIFEPFFTTKAKGKGTGLGLSTVFGIVYQCGGSIWVYSELGRGTTFKVFLPRVDATLDLDQPVDASTSLRGTETILLVEDDEQVRVVARGILRKQGYKVLEACNAGEAMLLCEVSGAIELLLSDVVMPQMSGPELAKRLGKARPEMKLLCMSGYTDDSIVRHGVLEGDIAFLQKPLTPDALSKKVREVLDSP